MGWWGTGRRSSPLGALPLVCTIGFRSAEGGEMELPDSESVCAFACVSVCLSPPGPGAAEARGGVVLEAGEAPSSCLYLPHLTNFGPFPGH